MAGRPKNDEIDPLVKQFQALQEQANALASGRQNFLSRLNENKMVSEVRVGAATPSARPRARSSELYHPCRSRPLFRASISLLRTRPLLLHAHAACSCRSSGGWTMTRRCSN